MQTSLSIEKIQYWENSALLDVEYWQSHIHQYNNQIYYVPRILLDKNPALNEYKINIINSINKRSEENINILNNYQAYLDFSFDRLFTRCVSNIDNFDKITLLALKFDLAAVLQSSNLLYDKKVILDIIDLAKNSLHLLPLIENHNALNLICEDRYISLCCVQKCPQTINAISTYLWETKRWTIQRIEEDEHINNCFKIAYTSDPTISNYFLFINETCPNTFTFVYDKWIYKKIIQINAASYIHIDWKKIMDRFDGVGENHFIYLRDLINEQFFDFRDENCKNLIREAHKYKPELVSQFSKLYFQKQHRMIWRKTADIYFHY